MKIIEKRQAVYRPILEKPMEIVVFGSGSGTNLKTLLEAQKKHPSLFSVKAIFTDRHCHCMEIAKTYGIPLIYLSFSKFFKEHGEKDTKNPLLRQKYDQEVVKLLLDLSKKEDFSIDLIVLAGYMRLLTSSILDNFSYKVINVHPADLTKEDTLGNRIYIGSQAVFKALSLGEKKTRSCVFFVDESVDGGPILVSGPWVSFSKGKPLTEKIVLEHQEKQKKESDWKALIEAVLLIAKGNVEIDRDRNIFIEGQLQKKCGLEM